MTIRTLLHGGQVFDGSGAPSAAADVVVADGQIVEVGPGLDGDVVVDVTGATVLPGLFDCHVHVTVSGVDVMQRLTRPFSYQFYAAAENLRATLAAGITTARDAGGADLGIQQALADGLIAGPRLLLSVNIIGQTGGHTDGWFPSGLELPLSVPHPGRPAALADGPDELRRVVRSLLRAGADVIKICTTGGVLSPRDDPRHTQFGPDELDVVVAEAAAAGRGVMAHAQGAAGIKNALRAGVRSIEHGIYLDDEAIDLLLEREAWLVPTLVAPRAVLAAASAGAQLPPAVVSKAAEVSAVHLESVRRAAAAGVRIAMGTDSGVGPHGQNLDELPLMQECGMTPEQVLVASTAEAARLCGLQDRTGRLEPGLAADLLVVDGDAREFDGFRDRIRQVWQAGRPVVGGPKAA
ncbi:metal-dependent hydrolase family protein [Pseudonocardia nigra]|uniref:metal-dependent hydrolase family protein n=1 Tax=Pseudonocardia nigra TaxID=1921578 RepID=UPI001C5E24D0|nr:amidohydrolase family protein [Pseudonocardia nigra]